MSHQRWRTFRRGTHHTRWTRKPKTFQVRTQSRNSHWSSDTCQLGRMSRKLNQLWTAFRRDSRCRRLHPRRPKRSQQGKGSTDRFRSPSMSREGSFYKRFHMNPLPSQLDKVSTRSCHRWGKSLKRDKGHSGPSQNSPNTSPLRMPCSSSPP